MSFLLGLLGNPLVTGLIAGAGIGFGTGTLVNGSGTTIVAEEGSTNTFDTTAGATTNDNGIFGGMGSALGDIVKMIGPILLLSMIGGGGLFGGGGGLFGGRGSTTSSTSPVIVIEDDD